MKDNSNLIKGFIIATIILVISIMLSTFILERITEIISISLTFTIFIMTYLSKKYLNNKGIEFIGITYIGIFIFLIISMFIYFDGIERDPNLKFIFIKQLVFFIEAVLIGLGFSVFINKSKIKANLVYGITFSALIIIYLVVYMNSDLVNFELFTQAVYDQIIYIASIVIYLTVMVLIQVNKKRFSEFEYKSILLVMALRVLPIALIILAPGELSTVLFYIGYISGLAIILYVVYYSGMKIPLFNSIEELEENRDELLSLQKIDELTLVANRRYLMENTNKLFRLAKRENQSLVLLMIDIDDFKEYNDIFGTKHGDSILKRLAKGIEKSCMRPLDFIGRYGGEEFLVVLPNSDFDSALIIAKRIKKMVRDLRIVHYNYKDKFLTVSIGFSVKTPQQEDDYEFLIQQADAQMYKVKSTGKNDFMGIDLDKENNNE